MSLSSLIFKRESVNYGPQMLCTVWFLTGLSVIFLGLRIYCKISRHKLLWYDDHILILSWFALATSVSLITVEVSLGFGRPNADIGAKNINSVLLIGYLAGFASTLAAAWSKTSWAVTLLRISDGWTKMLIWFFIITVNLVLGVNGLIMWIQCWPLNKVWQPLTHGTCWPKAIVVDYNYVAAAYSGAVDIALALLPWKILWSMSMTKREKFGALFAMSMGIFAGITSLLKIVTVMGITQKATMGSVNLLIFGTAEGAVTIVAASIPILRVLFRERQQQFPGPTSEHWPTASSTSRVKADQV